MKNHSTITPSASEKANPFKIASADATHLRNVFGGVLNTIGAMDCDKKLFTSFLCGFLVRKKKLDAFAPERVCLFANIKLLAADEILPNCVHTFCSVQIARNVGLGSNTGHDNIAAGIRRSAGRSSRDV